MKASTVCPETTNRGHVTPQNECIRIPGNQWFKRYLPKMILKLHFHYIVNVTTFKMLIASMAFSICLSSKT